MATFLGCMRCSKRGDDTTRGGSLEGIIDEELYSGKSLTNLYIAKKTQTRRVFPSAHLYVAKKNTKRRALPSAPYNST